MALNPVCYLLFLNNSDEYMPKSSTKEFPPPLKALKDTKYMEMEYHNLLTERKLVAESIDITAESADSIEKLHETRAIPTCGLSTELDA